MHLAQLPYHGRVERLTNDSITETGVSGIAALGELLMCGVGKELCNFSDAQPARAKDGTRSPPGSARLRGWSLLVATPLAHLGLPTCESS